MDDISEIMELKEKSITERTKAVVLIPVTKTKKPRTILERLYLDGFNELKKAETKKEKALWSTVIVVCYSTAVVLAAITLTRYHIGRTVFKIDDKTQKDLHRYFPQLTLCHTGHWNKTYIEENLDIPEEVLVKAAELGFTKDDLLPAFARYMKYYSITNSDDFEPEVWNLLTEIFQHNFKNVHFSDFVSDAAYRHKELFSNCQFAKYRYQCNAVALTIDIPSCYMLAVGDAKDKLRYWDLHTYDYDSPLMTFDINLPKKHLFNMSEKDMGVRMILSGEPPTPFSRQLVVPADTHAVVTFEHVFTRLKKNCLKTVPPLALLSPHYYSYDICLVEELENKTKEICGCHFIAGDYYPRNDLVCTPNMSKNCATPNIVETELDRDTRITQLKNRCHRMCSQINVVSSATFYNLYNTGDSIRNTFAIRQSLNRWIYQTEVDVVDVYTIIFEIGNLLGVYTGLSGAAFAHALVLIISASLSVFELKIVKPFLWRRLEGKIPIAVPKKQRNFVHCRSITRSKRVQPINE